MLSCLHIQFFTRNPNFRSKRSKSGTQEGKFRIKILRTYQASLIKISYCFFLFFLLESYHGAVTRDLSEICLVAFQWPGQNVGGIERQALGRVSFAEQAVRAEG